MVALARGDFARAEQFATLSTVYAGPFEDYTGEVRNALAAERKKICRAGHIADRAE